MKRIIAFLIILCLFVPLLSVGASNSVMSATQHPVAVGNKIYAQITVYSDVPVYAMEVKLKYDTTKLEPIITDEVSAKSDYVYSAQGDSGGTVKSFTFYFKALEKGVCNFSAYDIYYVDSSLTKHSIAGTTCSATVCVAGDINNDGEANLLDLMALKRYMAGTYQTEHFIAADFNDTGSIEAADLISLKKEILK